jgi:hypothetical protein
MRDAQRLQVEYEKFSGREVLLLTADLDVGWRNLGEIWGFDEEARLATYEQESTFVCRLRLRHAKGLTVPAECLESFVDNQSVEKVDRGTFSVEHDRQFLKVRIPIKEQNWVPTINQSRHPSVYFFEESLLRAEVENWVIPYDMQVWIRLRGRTKMFVPDKFEWGDGFAWVGGRPESNRRRF